MKVDVKGNELVITLDISKAAIEAAQPSKSDKPKMRMVASTGGFTGITTPNGLVRLSLNLGVPL